MRIRRIEIEQFGHWRDATLTLAPRGLTVLFGPNETGKSSLVRFIREVLYGFQAQDEAGDGARPRFTACAGELHLEADGDAWSLGRSSSGGGHPELRRSGSTMTDATPTLTRLLGGVSRDVFERVFAIGLSELQELATLNDREVAGLVYQTSLGDDGERIMGALRRAEADRQALLNPTAGKKGIPHWRDSIRKIDARLQEYAQDESRMASLEQERSKLQDRIAEQQWRQQGLREQLRGHAFMERVWGPWNRQRKLQMELAALPDVEGFPPDGAAQFREIESEIANLRSQRDRWQAKRRRLREQRQQLSGSSAIARHAEEIRRLLQEQESVRAEEVGLPAIKARAVAAQRRLDECRQQLANGWSESRLEGIDLDAGAGAALLQQADRFRTAARRRTRAIRSYRRSSSALRREQAQLDATLQEYSGAEISEAEDQIRAELQDLCELQNLEAQHESNLRLLAALREDDQTADARRELPRNFYRALAALGVAGIVLMGVGMWRITNGGSLHAGLVGAIFALLGVCCAGITWTIKQRFEPTEKDDSQRREREQKLVGEIAQLERDMHSLIGRVRGGAPDVAEGEMRIAGRDGVDDVSDAEQVAERIGALADQLSRLGIARQRESELIAERENQARRRLRIRMLQQTLGQTRREWCAALRAAGLDESVRVAASLETWQLVQAARRAQLEARSAQAEAEGVESSLRAYSERVQSIAREINEFREDESPDELLMRIGRGLDAAAATVTRRAAARREWRASRAEMKAMRRQRRKLATDRRRLLSSVGANSRDEFLRLDASWRRKTEIEALLDEAGDELSRIAAGEPELAIVEDDLTQFDADGNREAVETIETELSDLEDDLRVDHERLGRLEQELEAFRQDRTLIELRFERAQAEVELQQLVQELGGIELARRAVDQLRERLESERQPATLRSAGQYLQQLTAGKYQRVWAPLGEQSLVVDDDRQRSFRVDQLSSGTREQLFLAIRFALIDDFVGQGAELPIVLDDVFVNFDQRRTQAAVQTVIDYAADGRQLLLLTCHQHLVSLFADAGATTVRLPEPEGLMDRRRVG